MHTKNPNRFTDSDLYVSRDAYPEWPTAAEVLPTVGDEVYCVEGIATVVRILGKTGDGSRLLELKLPEEKAKPFFAAASNVLVRPKMAA